MPKIYLIAGCNGAGKLTVSFAMLPEMISEGIKELELEVFNEQIWATMKKFYYGK